MTRINTNVDSLIALNNLGRSNTKLGVSLTRLSTGVRVNSGKDDPAGLISGEFLRQEIASVQSAITNNNRANNVLATADTALAQIGTLLEEVRGVLTTSANKGVLSQEEIDANQQVVDSAVSSIDRIAATTQFAGRKLLDGSLGFQLSGVNRFDAGNATFTDVRINLANFDAAGNDITVTVTLVTRAAQASLSITAANAAADSTIQVIGNRGSATINIGTGQSVAAAVNAVSDVTGVTATGTTLNSVDYGTRATVTVKNVVGSVINTSEASAQGSDASGTINGNKFTANGLNGFLRSANLDLDVTFSAGAANNSAATFTITGGGAQFQLGLEINGANQINIGLQNFSSASLGTVRLGTGGVLENRTLASIVTGGENSLLNNKASIAADIVKNAIGRVGTARARLGALQKDVIESNVNSLQVNLENLSAARSAIVDTDFASETANLTRLQILVQAGTSALAIANSRPQSVLSLLGGQ